MMEVDDFHYNANFSQQNETELVTGNLTKRDDIQSLAPSYFMYQIGK